MLLATGVEDVQPPIGDLDNAIRRGLVRHCPTCDAYEVQDRRIAIIGAGICRVQEEMLLRTYTGNLTVLSLGRELETSQDERADLHAPGIRLIDHHQRTSVPGLYAVGDVVAGLTQIGVAMGQAAIAASAISSGL